jgi:1,4-dihydroxy-2-naphthoyl-CoA hydrolase
MGQATDDTAAAMNAMHSTTWAGRMGLRMVRASRDEVVAELDVREEHRQPHGIVHGGVHSSIVETLASIGSAIDAIAHGKTVVGLENHTTFIRAVREGTLHATATPLTRGRRTQVWETSIRDGKGALVATGRVRMLVIEPDAEVAGAALGSKMTE